MLRLGTRLYAAVTRLLPSDMRASVGSDLVQAFEDQCRMAAREGRARALGVWARGFLNLSWTVLAERWLVAFRLSGKLAQGQRWGWVRSSRT